VDVREGGLSTKNRRRQRQLKIDQPCGSVRWSWQGFDLGISDGDQNREQRVRK
jgi:hypothetical protein